MDDKGRYTTVDGGGWIDPKARRVTGNTGAAVPTTTGLGTRQDGESDWDVDLGWKVQVGVRSSKQNARLLVGREHTQCSRTGQVVGG